jgi:hypothetical protein
MSFILVDANHMFHRARHVVGGSGTELGGMGMHLVLNGIRKVWRRGKGSHVVIALDGKSWRSTLYPKYKAHRRLNDAKKTEAEREDDAAFFGAMRELEKFFKEKSNCTVLFHEILEADDLIARFVARHPNDQHVIITGDSDYKQLLADNVRIYDGMKHELIALDGILDDNDKPVMDKEVLDKKTGAVKKPAGPKLPGDPAFILFEKCIRGDSSDNIFSAYPRVRKSVIENAYADRFEQGYCWNNLMLHTWRDHDNVEHLVRDVYERNVSLIDLKRQPPEIIGLLDAVIDAAVAPKATSQIGLYFMKFAAKWELEQILDQMQRFKGSFVDFLTAAYPGTAGEKAA